MTGIKFHYYIKLCGMSKAFLRVSLFIMVLLSGGVNSNALHNQYGAHDPSSIIKCGDTYWIFTTGMGIYSMYSNDLVKWTSGVTPFVPGNYPSWVQTYVPGFGGHFWAPECFYMNGKYYLYYSCSSWGSRQSTIGLLTTKSLNPGSDDYYWNDEGMVVYSTVTSDVNCIDPSVFRDDEGKIWLTYGSYSNGIRIVQLDSISGKVTGSYHYPVANNNCEASYVINGKDYYYLFINRGSCCVGTSSTYHIQVGRSLSPTGPFLDKLGNNLNQGGGSTILATSGNYIGPGHTGYFVENNIGWISYHYYDGNDAGVAKLGMAHLEWSDDSWPVFSTNWITDGYYSLLNKSSQLAWDLPGGSVAQSPVKLGSYTELGTQKWKFESLGSGYYHISPAGQDLVAELTSCTASVGTIISIGANESKSCEIWKVEKTNDHSLVFSSKYGNRVIEVPAGSNIEGTALQANYYSGDDSQKWNIADTFVTVSVNRTAGADATLNIYPDPVTGESFNIGFDRIFEDFDLFIYTIDGKVVYSKHFTSSLDITINTRLDKQVYILGVRNRKEFLLKKFIVI